jgi:hypothetical protein
VSVALALAANSAARSDICAEVRPFTRVRLPYYRAFYKMLQSMVAYHESVSITSARFVAFPAPTHRAMPRASSLANVSRKSVRVIRIVRRSG